MLVSALLCMITGIVKWPYLPQALGFSYKALPMEIFSEIHDWSGLAVVLLAIIHLVMHRKWLVFMTRNFVQQGDD